MILGQKILYVPFSKVKLNVKYVYVKIYITKLNQN